MGAEGVNTDTLTISSVIFPRNNPHERPPIEVGAYTAGALCAVLIYAAALVAIAWPRRRR